MFNPHSNCNRLSFTVTPTIVFIIPVSEMRKVRKMQMRPRKFCAEI